MSYQLGMAMMAGIVIGSTGVHIINAQQNMMAAYFVTEVSQVDDQPAFGKILQELSTKQVAAGGRYLAFGGRIQGVSGEVPKRITMIAYDSFDQANKWYGSSEYKAYLDRIAKVAKARSFIVEGTSK